MRSLVSLFGYRPSLLLNPHSSRAEDLSVWLAAGTSALGQSPAHSRLSTNVGQVSFIPSSVLGPAHRASRVRCTQVSPNACSAVPENLPGWGCSHPRNWPVLYTRVFDPQKAGFYTFTSLSLSISEHVLLEEVVPIQLRGKLAHHLRNPGRNGFHPKLCCVTG